MDSKPKLMDNINTVNSYFLSYFPIEKPKANNVASGWKEAEVNSLSRVKDCVLKFPWSPIVWHQGNRNSKAFKKVNLCALDFDNGELSLDQAIKEFCDMIHIIGTTKSHQKEKNGLKCDRFRVIFLFNKIIDNYSEYSLNMRKLTKKYSCDKSCKDGGRFFFPCLEIVSFSDDGYKLDALTDLEIEKEKDKMQKNKPYSNPHFAKDKYIPPWLKTMLRHADERYNRNSNAFKISCRMQEIGYPKDFIWTNLRRAFTPEFTDQELMMVIEHSERYYRGEKR